MAASPGSLWDLQEHKREKKHLGGGQQKLVSAGLRLRCDFSIPLPIIRTCSTTHVGTAHGSVSSGMFQTKITLFMFSNLLKFYTGMALVKMSIKSKVTVCSQSTYFLTGLIFSISITLCTQQANRGVTWKLCREDSTLGQQDSSVGKSICQASPMT